MTPSQATVSPYRAVEAVVGSKGLLALRLTHFVLWRPALPHRPALYLGTFNDSTGQLTGAREIALHQIGSHPDLYGVPAADCHLDSGRVYHYWFKVLDTNPYAEGRRVVYCTDPLAWTVDRRILAPAPASPGGAASGHPASVLMYRNGRLWPCDPAGGEVDWSGEPTPSQLPQNCRLVIYELPTRWTKVKDPDDPEPIGDGTFQDVLALVEVERSAPSHPRLSAAGSHRSHLLELGVNALELLPPADNPSEYGWGYGTSNYLAASFYLGLPDDQRVPTASTDLAMLINHCHRRGIRFFYDAVMAFSRDMPYSSVNFPDFLVQWGAGDPAQGDREGFGGDLFNFDRRVEGFNPLTGERGAMCPAAQFLKAHIAHWICYYHIDGIRMDSVNNIANWDFVQEFKDFARSIWQARWAELTGGQDGGDGRFLVVGEELSVPIVQVHEQRLEGLWNEQFKYLLRRLLVGETGNDMTFAETVQKMVNCQLLGFQDGSQAVNYVTSHDTGGEGNERLFNYLDHHGVVDKENRLRLAFVCLLTAVGTPMILAGDEFGDQTDIETEDRKEVDPVGFERLNEPWRAGLFQHVSRLVRLRTHCDALCVNDTEFLYWDTDDDKRIVVWQRGGGDKVVVVVANFSDFKSDEFTIPTWPDSPPGRSWREITESLELPADTAGCVPVTPWTARVYELH